MFAIIRTRWHTRPLSRRAKRRSSAAPGSLRKKYTGIVHPPDMVCSPNHSTTSGDHRKLVLYLPYGEQQIDRDQFHFTECVVESSPVTFAECAAGLRRLLEQIWNTAGFADQQSINNNGVWQLGA